LDIKGYEVNEEIREGVLRSMPMINQIKNADLREKVLDAWALTLSLNGFNDLAEVHALPGYGHFCPQPKHIQAVAKMALALADIYDEYLDEPLGLDRDLLLVCALCHDLGNPYEYNEEKRRRWQEDPGKEGFPCLRHTFFGAHIALLVGLPDIVAQANACHSQEGTFITRSVSTQLLFHVDDMFWKVIKAAHNML
jgi:putative nucleotidyltransferase with HDIG domain